MKGGGTGVDSALSPSPAESVPQGPPGGLGSVLGLLADLRQKHGRRKRRRWAYRGKAGNREREEKESFDFSFEATRVTPQSSHPGFPKWLVVSGEPMSLFSSPFSSPSAVSRTEHPLGQTQQGGWIARRGELQTCRGPVPTRALQCSHPLKAWGRAWEEWIRRRHTALLLH